MRVAAQMVADWALCGSATQAAVRRLDCLRGATVAECFGGSLGGMPPTALGRPMRAADTGRVLVAPLVELPPSNSLDWSSNSGGAATSVAVAASHCDSIAKDGENNQK